MEIIIILALVFFFVGLRLYSVLGRRTGHEQPIAKPAEGRPAAAPGLRPVKEQVQQTPIAAAQDAAIEPSARDGLRAIAAADPRFDSAEFLGGAQAAYRMILEAYWQGDLATLDGLVDDQVRADFSAAIDARAEAGHVIDNRLVSIERAVIDHARLDGQAATITVRFDADIAAVTRDTDGNVIAGSLSDAVPTHDVWTFSRNVRTDDPNWLLIETDEAA